MNRIVWPRRKWQRALGSAALLASLLGLPRAAAQDQSETAGFGEVVEVNVVNVDVVVTDGKGRPVTGLEAADFELLEDGRAVEITHFSFVGGTPAAAGSGTSDGGDPLQPALGERDSTAAVEADGLWLVIYVDNLHLRLFERTRALDKLQALVREQLSPADRVMVVTYDRALRARLGFTSDLERVEATLRDLGGLPAGGDRHDSEQRRLLRFIETASGPKDAVEAIRPHAGQVRGDLWGALKGLEEAVDLVAGLPGSKSILYVSGGLPLKPGAMLFNAVEYRWPGLLGIHELMLFDQTTEFENLGRHASARGVVLHTLDAAGVRAARSSGVEEELKNVVAISANMDADLRTNHQLPLRQLADVSGGRAILNRNDVGPALAQLSEQMHSYYSLGFTPDRVRDDAFHRLTVRVRRDDVRLRYRHGYRDQAPAERMADRLRAALAHGITDNPLDLGVEVEAMRAAGANRFEVPIRITLPFRSLALLPQADGYGCRFQLYLAAMDDGGGMSEVLEIPASLRFDPSEVDRVRDSIWRMSQQLKMRAGSQRLAVGVRDELALTSAITTRTIQVGEPAG